jgi:murein hydrolase activator
MKLFVLNILILLVLENICYSQSNIEKIRENHDRILKEIEYANKLLTETQGKTKESLNEISIINHKLQKRREYITGLELELSLITKSINENEANIDELDNEINKIKHIYAIMIVSFYKNRNRNYGAMYILASENFNQLYKRIRIIKLFNNYLKKQKLSLEEEKNLYDKSNLSLNALKIEKNSLYKKQRVENVEIVSDLNLKRKLLNELKRKQKTIEIDIEAKKLLTTKFENEIRRLINDEKRKARNTNIRENLTPVERLTSTDFEKNLGRLPWPTQSGIITGKYGEHQHPDYKSVIIRNDGIYITTSSGEHVRSVFKGTISRVFAIPGENYSVIIKHGEYYTLYHNLINVTVKQGQSINTKDVIGTVATNENSKETILYFQLWKETQKNDPELWLAHQ